MATAQSHTAQRTTPLPKSVPVGIAVELLLSDLTPEEYDALFGSDEQDTVPADLAQ